MSGGVSVAAVSKWLTPLVHELTLVGSNPFVPTTGRVSCDTPWGRYKIFPRLRVEDWGKAVFFLVCNALDGAWSIIRARQAHLQNASTAIAAGSSPSPTSASANARSDRPPQL